MTSSSCLLHSDFLIYLTGIEYINRDNFLTELDNGVVLCHLAQMVCDSAKQAFAAGLVKGVTSRTTL